MAKQEGIITLSGTIAGINFYIRNGKAVARRAGGGFNGKTIANSPKMVRVRENNSEFGNCSMMKKLFKDGLFPFFGTRKDSLLHGRMIGLFMAIKDCDTSSERGKRSVAVGLQTQAGKKLLTDFEFTAITLPITNAIVSSDFFSLTINNFDITTIDFVPGATHLELCYGVLVFDFDRATTVLHRSAVVTLATTAPATPLLLAIASFAVGTALPIGVLGYRMVQVVNGAKYPLKEVGSYGVRVLRV
jgi:hypothetical protein